jgi:hypothetical protein
MRQYINRLLMAGSLMAMGCANAEPPIALTPYLGVDYYQVNMKARTFYQQIFPSSFPSVSFYIGTKFHPNFSFEVGYGWSVKKSKQWVVSKGQPIFGSVSNGTFSGKTSIRRSSGYIDLVGYLPVYDICDAFEIIFSIGYGWVQSQIATTMNILPSPAIPNSSAIASLASKGRSTYRAGVGANYMVTDVYGLRGKVGWENTNTLRIRGNNYFDQIGYGVRSFKGSITLNLGAFFKF